MPKDCVHLRARVGLPGRWLARTREAMYSCPVQMRNSAISIVLLALLSGVLACNAPSPDALPPDIPSPDLPSATVAAETAATATPTQPAAPTLEPAVASPEPRPLRIAYVDAGDGWALELGSTPIQLTDSGAVSELLISDDGERIVYVVRDPDFDTAELRSVHFDGSGDQLLINAAAFDALYPLEEALHYTLSQFAFVPNSHQILFNTRAVFEGPGLAKNNDLILLDADSGVSNAVVERGEGGDFTISPDGTQVALVRPDSIGFVNLDGSDLRPEILTFPWVITYSEYFYYPYPVWSGASLLVAIPSEDPFIAPLTGTLWSVPADGSEPSLLATIDGNFFAPQRVVPSFSPDGKSVAFYDTDTSSGISWLVIQPIGAETRVIYDIDVLDWKGWAPASDYFVYTLASGLDLYLGSLGKPAVSLGTGSALQWVSATEYLYLKGSPGAWTLTLSAVNGVGMPLVDLASDRVVFDFAN